MFLQEAKQNFVCVRIFNGLISIKLRKDSCLVARSLNYSPLCHLANKWPTFETKDGSKICMFLVEKNQSKASIFQPSNIEPNRTEPKRAEQASKLSLLTSLKVCLHSLKARKLTFAWLHALLAIDFVILEKLAIRR